MTDDFSALEEATMRIDELEYELSDAELKIQRVRELHSQSGEVHVLGGSMPICSGCRTFYPCETIKALDGEQ